VKIVVEKVFLTPIIRKKVWKKFLGRFIFARKRRPFKFTKMADSFVIQHFFIDLSGNYVTTALFST
jgi:hypothetical protein